MHRLRSFILEKIIKLKSGITNYNVMYNKVKLLLNDQKLYNEIKKNLSKYDFSKYTPQKIAYMYLRFLDYEKNKV